MHVFHQTKTHETKIRSHKNHSESSKSRKTLGISQVFGDIPSRFSLQPRPKRVSLSFPPRRAMGAGPLRGQVPLTALGPEDVLSAAPWNPWNGRLGGWVSSQPSWDYPLVI